MNDLSMYEELMDRYYNSRFKGLPENCVKASSMNVSCGDFVELGIVLDNGKITSIGFEGNGCIISQACASVLCELLQGKTLQEVKHLTSEEFLKAMPVEIPMHRLKCALTSFKALQALLKKVG